MVEQQPVLRPASPARTGNRYDRLEWAGAFGDLGTLIPFALAYLTVLRVDPAGLLLAFGLAKVVAGLFYRTPIPVQPMKAIGAAAVVQAGGFTPAAVWGAGLTTGAVWLILGLTGAVGRVASLARPPVVQGIMLGLGFSFMAEGGRAMAGNLPLAALALALALLNSRRLPAMFLLLALGLGASLAAHPGLAAELARGFGFRPPALGLGGLTWPELARGALLLALPQVPLTLGNAIIAITAENNQLFPQRRVSERQMAISTGIMNLLSPWLGGVPMCHGAGGMAGHVRFGARTGGALVILGGLLLLLALFYSAGVDALFRLFPPAVLGVILFLAGAELALAARPGGERRDLYVTLCTAGLAMWNMGAAFLAGIILQAALARGWVRLQG